MRSSGSIVPSSCGNPNPNPNPSPNPNPNPKTLTLTRLYAEPLYWLACVGSVPTAVNHLSQLQSEPLVEYFFGSLCLDNTTALFYMLFLGCSVPPYVLGWGEWANVFVALAALSGSLCICRTGLEPRTILPPYPDEQAGPQAGLLLTRA